MPRLFLSPTGFVSGDSTLTIKAPSVQNPDTEVSASAPGDFKWVYLGIPITSEQAIQAIVVHYQLSNKESFISQVRLTEMTTPDRALVVHDDGTDLHSTTPSSYTSQVNGKRPRGALTLALRLNFAGTGASHKINLGAVFIDLA